jgi:hypothetical protein
LCGHSPGYQSASHLEKLCTLSLLAPNLHVGVRGTLSFVRRLSVAYYPKLWEKRHWNGQTIDRCIYD